MKRHEMRDTVSFGSHKSSYSRPQADDTVGGLRSINIGTSNAEQPAECASPNNNCVVLYKNNNNNNNNNNNTPSVDHERTGQDSSVSKSSFFIDSELDEWTLDELAIDGEPNVPTSPKEKNRHIPSSTSLFQSIDLSSSIEVLISKPDNVETSIRESGIAMDRGSDGRTLGHKRLYCAQCASNADIGKLLAPSSDSHRIHPPTTVVAASQNRTRISGNPEKYRCPKTLIGNVKESRTRCSERVD
ncbi:hypothetical protein WN51_12276 [Melipona quadrifasciata]|uniref:Uncharacterized protein n=1 Tax=Melipona quadrifasciata TaxID=166423 RepID=A0A0N1ITQ1_9HYME|nr:hypothetical protein WN51_12276 [Melipona quadrifasciata]